MNESSLSNPYWERFHSAFLEKIIDNFPGVLLVLEPPPDFRVVLASSSVNEFLPEQIRSEGSIVGRTAMELSPELTPSGRTPGSNAMVAMLAQVYETGESLSFRQYEAATPLVGTRFWNWSILPIGGGDEPRYLMLIAHDITDLVQSQRKAQQAAGDARARAEELEAVIRQMADGVVIFDAEGLVVKMNPESERLLGGGTLPRSLPDIRSELFGLFTVDGSPYAGSDLPFTKALAGETTIGEQMLVRRPDGVELVISASASPLTDSTGTISGVVAVLHDITAEKIVERLKDEFLSIVSHELRTPLTAIMGYCDLMLRGVHGSLGDKQARVLNSMRSNADRLLHLINDLLDVSRLELGSILIEPEPIDLNNVLSRTIAHTRVLAAEAGVNVLNLVAEQPLPRVLADDPRLQQIIENLLSNALKFTPTGGSVTFDARLSPLEAGDPRLMAAPDFGLDSPKSVVVSVTDTGAGLEEDQLARIWDRFYQVDATSRRRAGGAGLGLTIVRNLLDLHGGQVWATSEGASRGSVFRFSLPVANLKAEGRSKNEE